MKRNSCLNNENSKEMKQEWIDLKFSYDLREVIRERFALRKDEIPLSIRRVTKAMRNLGDWNNILERLTNADIKEDRWKNENDEE